VVYYFLAYTQLQTSIKRKFRTPLLAGRGCRASLPGWGG